MVEPQYFKQRNKSTGFQAIYPGVLQENTSNSAYIVKP